MLIELGLDVLNPIDNFDKMLKALGKKNFAEATEQYLKTVPGVMAGELGAKWYLATYGYKFLPLGKSQVVSQSISKVVDWYLKPYDLIKSASAKTGKYALSKAGASTSGASAGSFAAPIAAFILAQHALTRVVGNKMDKSPFFQRPASYIDVAWKLIGLPSTKHQKKVVVSQAKPTILQSITTGVISLTPARDVFNVAYKIPNALFGLVTRKEKERYLISQPYLSTKEDKVNLSKSKEENRNG